MPHIDGGARAHPRHGRRELLAGRVRARRGVRISQQIHGIVCVGCEGPRLVAVERGHVVELEAPVVVPARSRRLGTHHVACQVRLELAGQETELDRTILEAIMDPLTHILRNAVDHGIERPTERIASNKPEEGTIVCRAYHEGGQVIIEITDDGRGIDPQRVLQKALASNLVRPDEAMRLSEGELLALIDPQHDSAPDPGQATDAVVERWTAAIKSLDGPLFEALIDAEASILGLLPFLTKRVGPFTRSVGERWLAGELEVYQEHFATQRLEGFLIGSIFVAVMVDRVFA